MIPQVLAGYRTVLKINNDVVAAGFVLDYSIETGEVDIHGLDNIVPTELAPDMIRVTMDIKVYRTPDNDPVGSLIAPLGDSANPLDAFTKTPYISVEIRDKQTDKTILFLPRAWLFRRSGSVDAENVLIETWNIKSIGFYGPGSQQTGIVGAVQSVFG
jgi:hypothetical protein